MSILASCDAASAKDALGGISDECGCELVDKGLGMNACISSLTGACELGYMEQLAFAVLFALLAVLIVVGEKQLHASSAGLEGSRRVDADLHPVCDGIDTAGHKSPGSGRLDKADTT